MKTVTEEQSKKTQTTSRTSQTSPAGSILNRFHVSGDPSRRERSVETSLTEVLNLRVGCWRPPILMDSRVVDRVLKRIR